MSRRKAKREETAAEPEGGPPRISVGGHPRARASIRRTRARAGIAGFVLVLALSLNADVPTYDALWRALAGGVVAHFGAWFAALALWRRLVVAELELARRRLVEKDELRAAAQAEAAGT
jgi:hypothetical protein